MKTYLIYIDKFVFPNKGIGYTENHKKIEKNLSNFPDIYNKMQFAKIARKRRLNLVFDCSDYIVCLNMDLTKKQNSLMHFFNVKLDLKKILTETPVKQLFSVSEINSIIEYQKKIIQNIHIIQRESIFLTLAESFEMPTGIDNIYTCLDDNIVIEKAKELGVYYTIERTDLALQTALIHELKNDKQSNKILDLFCFMHFDKKENPIDNGFVYIRFHDALNNIEKTENFFDIVTKTVGDFDRAFFTNTLKSFMSN
jgi:hypothetical protein